MIQPCTVITTSLILFVNIFINLTTASTLLVGVNRPTGIVNGGNTCYMNSVLQALYIHPAIRQVVLEYAQFDQLSQDLSDDCIAEESAILLKGLQSVFTRLAIARPNECVDASADLIPIVSRMSGIQNDLAWHGPKRRSGSRTEKPPFTTRSRQRRREGVRTLHQFDVQEFYTMLLDKLPLSIKSMFVLSQSVDTAYGDRVDELTHLLLGFSDTGNTLVSLSSIAEPIDRLDLSQAISAHIFGTLPPIILVNLARSTGLIRETPSHSQQHVVAFIQSPVSYFSSLYLYSKEDHSLTGQMTTYKLFSVICHVNEATHFVSYVRSFTTGTWYLINDDIVMKVNEQTVLDQQTTAVSWLYYREDSLPDPSIKTRLPNSLLCQEKYNEDGYKQLSFVQHKPMISRPCVIRSNNDCIMDNVEPKKSTDYDEYYDDEIVEEYQYIYPYPKPRQMDSEKVPSKRRMYRVRQKSLGNLDYLRDPPGQRKLVAREVVFVKQHQFSNIPRCKKCNKHGCNRH